jgi:hypothetical protein
MSLNLRKDICDLKAPGVRFALVERRLVEQLLPRAVQYACSRWVRHVSSAEAANPEFGGILAFLEKHLLHWLEALCLLERSSEAIYMLGGPELISISDSFVAHTCSPRLIAYST